eukprot:217988_1
MNNEIYIPNIQQDITQHNILNNANKQNEKHVPLSYFDFIWKIPLIEKDKQDTFVCGYLRESFNHTLDTSILKIILNILINYINDEPILNEITSTNVNSSKFYSPIFCVNYMHDHWCAPFKFVITRDPSQNKIAIELISHPLSSGDAIKFSCTLFIVETNQTIKHEADVSKSNDNTYLILPTLAFKIPFKTLTFAIKLDILTSYISSRDKQCIVEPKLQFNHHTFITNKTDIVNKHYTSHIFKMHSLKWRVLISCDNDFGFQITLKCGEVKRMTQNIYFHYKLVLEESDSKIDGFGQYTCEPGNHNANRGLLGKFYSYNLGEMKILKEKQHCLRNSDSFTFSLQITIIDIFERNAVVTYKYCDHTPKIYRPSQSNFRWTIGKLQQQTIYLLYNGYLRQLHIYIPTSLINLFVLFYDNHQNVTDTIKYAKFGQTYKSRIFMIGGIKLLMTFMHKPNKQRCGFIRQKHRNSNGTFSVHLVSAPPTVQSIQVDHKLSVRICYENANGDNVYKSLELKQPPKKTNSYGQQQTASDIEIQKYRTEELNNNNLSFAYNTMYSPHKLISIDCDLEFNILDVYSSQYRYQIISDCKTLQNTSLSTCTGEYVWNVLNSEWTYLKNNNFVRSKVFVLHGFKWFMKFYPKGLTNNQTRLRMTHGLMLHLVKPSINISTASFVCTIYIGDEINFGYTEFMRFKHGSEYTYTHPYHCTFALNSTDLSTDATTSFRIVIELVDIFDKDCKSITKNYTHTSKQMTKEMNLPTYDYEWKLPSASGQKATDLINGYIRKLTTFISASLHSNSQVSKLCLQYFKHSDILKHTYFQRSRGMCCGRSTPPGPSKYLYSNIFIMGAFKWRMQIKINCYGKSYFYIESVATQKPISQLTIIYKVKVHYTLDTEIQPQINSQARSTRYKRNLSIKKKSIASFASAPQFSEKIFTDCETISYAYSEDEHLYYHQRSNNDGSIKFEFLKEQQMIQVTELRVQLEMNVVEALDKNGNEINFTFIPKPLSVHSFIDYVTWEISNDNLMQRIRHSQISKIMSPIFTMHSVKFYLEFYFTSDRSSYSNIKIRFASFPFQTIAMSFCLTELNHTQYIMISDDGFVKHSHPNFSYRKEISMYSKMKTLDKFVFNIQMELLDAFDKNGDNVIHKFLSKSKANNTIYNEDEFADYALKYMWNISEPIVHNKDFNSQIYVIDGIKWMLTLNVVGNRKLRNESINVSLHLMDFPASIQNIFVKWRIVLGEHNQGRCCITQFDANNCESQILSFRIQSLLSSLMITLQLSVIDMYDDKANKFRIECKENKELSLCPQSMSKVFQWIIDENNNLNEIKTAKIGTRFCSDYFKLSGFEFCLELYPNGELFKEPGKQLVKFCIKTIPFQISNVMIHYKLTLKETNIVKHGYIKFSEKQKCSNAFHLFIQQAPGGGYERINRDVSSFQKLSFELTIKLIYICENDGSKLIKISGTTNDIVKYQKNALQVHGQQNEYEFTVIKQHIRNNIFHSNIFKMHCLKWCVIIVFNPLKVVLKCIFDANETSVYFYYRLIGNINEMYLETNGYGTMTLMPKTHSNKSPSPDQKMCSWTCSKPTFPSTKIPLNRDKSTFKLSLTIIDILSKKKRSINNKIITNEHINHKPVIFDSSSFIWRIGTIPQTSLSLLYTGYLRQICKYYVLVRNDLINLLKLFYCLDDFDVNTLNNKNHKFQSPLFTVNGFKFFMQFNSDYKCFSLR